MTSRDALKAIAKKLGKYFIDGLIIVGPLALSLFVLWKILIFLDSIIPVRIPGLGIIILFAGITLVGYLTNLFAGRYVFSLLENIIRKVPVLSTIYKTIQRMTEVFSGTKKGIGKPAIILLTENPPVYKPGFVISAQDGRAVVLLPHSFNYSGNIFIVEESKVMYVDVPAATWFQIIISGGIMENEKLREALVRPDVSSSGEPT